MIKKLLLAGLAVLLLASFSWGATTLTCSNGSGVLNITKPRGTMKVYNIVLTTLTDDATCTISLEGYIYAVETNPDGSPTPNYDLTYTDSDGLDVFEGNLNNRHTTTTEKYQFSTFPFHAGTGTLKAEATGDAKTIEVIVQLFQVR